MSGKSESNSTPEPEQPPDSALGPFEADPDPCALLAPVMSGVMAVELSRLMLTVTPTSPPLCP